MSKRSLNDCRVLLTGASSGIGWALAKELAANHARLVVVARRMERLEKLKSQVSNDACVEIVSGDITDPVVRHLAITTAVEKFGGLDVLINNAGIGGLARFEDVDENSLRKIMEVNFFAAVELIRLAIPYLEQGTNPAIVNVASILAHRGLPCYSSYCSSKFALKGFTESLRIELSARGVDVLLISPGTTKTEFFENVVERNGELPWNNPRGVSPDRVAKAARQAMIKGSREIIPSTSGRMFVWFNRLAPGMMDKILRYMERRVRKVGPN